MYGTAHEYIHCLLQHDTHAEGSGVIKAICEAYTGSDKPDACSQ